jgi:chorismate mutase
MMLSELNHAAVNGQTDRAQLDVLWQRIQEQLEAEKERIVQEISQYPPPIPACDAQFNGLLEERATILQELGQVNQILKQHLTAREQIELLDEFMRSSHHLDGELAESIRQSLTTLLA